MLRTSGETAGLASFHNRVRPESNPGRLRSDDSTKWCIQRIPFSTFAKPSAGACGLPGLTWKGYLQPLLGGQREAKA